MYLVIVIIVTNGLHSTLLLVSDNAKVTILSSVNNVQNIQKLSVWSPLSMRILGQDQVKSNFVYCMKD